MVMSLVLLNLAGGDSVDDINKLEGDEGFCRILRKVEEQGLTRKERRELKSRWRKGQTRTLPSASANGIQLLRGYIYVHVCYDPDICSPRYTGLCRWASEGNISITPCHPSYMAPAFTMTGLSPVRMRYPSLGTLNVKDLTPFR